MGRHSLAQAPTQVQHPNRATARTVFQLVVGLMAALPLILADLGVEATTTGVIGIALGVSAAVTRIMAIPAVNNALERFLPALAADAGDSEGR
ncbi:hypothetical protein [Nocardia cyriacigeorgica]|uniref:hypothetical protein n=1 Tax=Nocardia cyriacigeorgica TaxID=135487 RepID=UPI002457309A|nr:hypothetical protein [Nocardia cyriacigeorgica]